MYNPLVSVIIPNYCHAKYLDQRIQSVLDQTYKNFEIIILDDCSSDDGASRAVIERYRSNPHVTHIEYNETNSGSTFKQWNKGLSLTKGDLIWIAESDDYCEKDLLATLVSEFEIDDRCVLAFVGSLYVDENGTPLRIKTVDKRIERLSSVQFINNYLSKGNIIKNASSAIFKKDIAKSIDLQYTKYKGAGDLLFWLEISECGNVAYIHEQLNMFRFHGTNTTQKMVSCGRNFRELYEIYNYLSTKMLFKSWVHKYKIRFDYIEQIKRDINDKDLKRELLAMWDPNHTNWIVATFVSFFRLYKKII